MLLNCPSCNKYFDIANEEPEIRKQFVCPHCLKNCEVTWLYPITIDFIEDNPSNPKRSIESKIITKDLN
jgi:hypothetical protein